jgi:uncharacterized membrane protein
LTLLLTLAGAMLIGLSVDAASLVWTRTNLQNAADLSADAVAMELRAHPDADASTLETVARALAARNVRQGTATTRVERTSEGVQVLLWREADIYFLRMFRADPLLMEARGKAAL